MTNDFHQLEWSAEIEDDLRQLVRLAVREDLDRDHDWTTLALVGPDQRGRAALIVRETGVIAGLRAAPVLIDEMHAAIDWVAEIADGDGVVSGTVVAELSGSARDMLVCERPLLNLLGHLSGIATLTRKYVEQVAGTQAHVYDTRKTTPGWRRLDKYSVRCGGGRNHRTGLFDAVLIKDNHLALAASEGLTPAEAVRRARDFLQQSAAQRNSEPLLVEIEIDGLEQFEDVLRAAPDIILLDNMPPAALREAVGRRNALAPAIELEASGGVTLDTIREIAQTGVERISVGALTHSARALDIGLDWCSPA
ncbi:MAG TPA: carboxylating nicotinate-nucleotide diphosphorylase [Lacipirellulaceae bacterium]